MPITSIPIRRPEALHALGVDIQNRDTQQQMLKALHMAENTMLCQFGKHAGQHPTYIAIRAALDAVKAVRS